MNWELTDSGATGTLRQGSFEARYELRDGVYYASLSEGGKPLTFEARESPQAAMDLLELEILRYSPQRG